MGDPEEMEDMAATAAAEDTPPTTTVTTPEMKEKVKREAPRALPLRAKTKNWRSTSASILTRVCHPLHTLLDEALRFHRVGLVNRHPSPTDNRDIAVTYLARI